jgi:hypothetical protein
VDGIAVRRERSVIPSEPEDTRERIEGIKAHYRRAQRRLLVLFALLFVVSTIGQLAMAQLPGMPVDVEVVWLPCRGF